MIVNVFENAACRSPTPLNGSFKELKPLLVLGEPLDLGGEFGVAVVVVLFGGTAFLSLGGRGGSVEPQLGDDEAELRREIEESRAEEIAHRDTAREHGARGAPAYGLLSGAVKTASRLAIWLSERV